VKVFRRMAAVRAARTDAESARRRWHTAADSLVSRARAHPVAMLGIAAGLGLVMGHGNMRPWRMPGVGALLGGGVAEGVAIAARLIDGFGTATRAAADDVAEGRHDGDRRGS